MDSLTAEQEALKRVDKWFEARLNAEHAGQERMNTKLAAIIGVLLMGIFAAKAQFNYSENNGTVTITGYTGTNSAVTIPSTVYGLPVTSIGNAAFSGCTSIVSLTIPNTVTSIGSSACIGCSSLANIVIPYSVTNIGMGVFDFCSSLVAIGVDGANPAYSSSNFVLFNKNQSTLIQCPGGKTGNYTIPSSVKTIGTQAFFSCTKLTSITIPNSVTSIQDVAFLGCGLLTAITVPGSVTSIGGSAFGNCSSLLTITVDVTNSNYSSLDGVLLIKTQSTLIQFPGGKTGNYTVPSAVTTIGSSAFFACSLSSVVIGNRVTNIENYAFESCSSLSSVKLPDSIADIRNSTFAFCTKLTSFTIPRSVTSIGNEAFYYCTRLNSVYFEGNTPTTDVNAFDLDSSALIYYLPGTTGWGATLGGRPTVLWNAAAQAPVVRNGQFAFDIVGTPNIPVMVEALSSLAGGTWVPLQTYSLTNGLAHFSDPQWTNFSARFYRLRSP